MLLHTNAGITYCTSCEHGMHHHMRSIAVIPPVLTPASAPFCYHAPQVYNSETKSKEFVKSPNPEFVPMMQRKFPKKDAPLLVRHAQT